MLVVATRFPWGFPVAVRWRRWCFVSGRGGGGGGRFFFFGCAGGGKVAVAVLCVGLGVSSGASVSFREEQGRDGGGGDDSFGEDGGRAVAAAERVFALGRSGCGGCGVGGFFGAGGRSSGCRRCGAQATRRHKREKNT